MAEEGLDSDKDPDEGISIPIQLVTRRSPRLHQLHLIEEEPEPSISTEEILLEIQEPLKELVNSQIVNDEPVDIYLPEPKSSRSMLKPPKDIRNSWICAVKNEYMNLIKNETFDLKDLPKKDDQIIPTSMIFKEKSTSKRTLDKLKAICCARGDLMEDPTDQDNWSICVSQRTVRTFIAFSTSMQRRPKQLDFIGAYLQDRMRERVFIRLQKEFSPFFITIQKYFSRPLLLKKTIYGLTVSAKYWNEELIKWLKNNNIGNFNQSSADQSLFCYRLFSRNHVIS